ncbi:hypothetical protein A2392_00460 [Candidatus Kaiserbacteria bacterium RIFOXYB1_FULL_46_14]|uniref:Uncharacterized protein n=1 Tax=Candidatus Kaiserbacteria bacterium RIFOXYB1_FULL_46_14 TaxID=1798531 RepID=A0A1F6FJ35_9BACT|nr:MAG: hypothetical protein A2392_00460 [Candidatus Kaiserbacteria bacterium RIFOXYB1_FULL_46_14]
MDVTLATFTFKEIKKLLADEGINENDPNFRKVLTERYRPSEAEAGRFVEREDWQPEMKKPARRIAHRSDEHFDVV